MSAGHTCHARGCARRIPPKLFMCLHHWRMVPRNLQQAIWATYRPGQEVDKQPSREYLDVARAAIDAVASKEAQKNSEESVTHTQVLLRELEISGRTTYRELLARYGEQGYSYAGFVAAVRRGRQKGSVAPLRSRKDGIIKPGHCPCCGRPLEGR